MGVKLTVKWVAEHYRKREVMVPMRDGVRLYTAIYEPAGIAGGRVAAEAHAARPVIMIRTPFPLNPYGKTFTRDLRGFMSLFAQNEYIIVYQNVRGRFMSEGEFENVRPYNPKAHSGSAAPNITDEATDTFDTAEWLLANCRTNGSIGVKGMSYPGFYATMAALSGHPSIKAVSPQAPVTDWFMGDDAHIGGIFQFPTFLFGASFFRPRKALTNRWPKAIVEPEGDLYDYFLDKGPKLLEKFRDKIPFFGDILDHPTYDEFWQDRNPLKHIKDGIPPMLVVGGFFDAEDSYGAFETYKKVKEQAPGTELYLCAGPWYHGAWKKKGYEALGDLHFTPGSAEYFREEVEYPFFARYLEGKGSGPESKVSILPSGETMPGNRQRPQWEHYEQWPPKNENKGIPILYKGIDKFEFRFDPEHPVPYTADVLENFTREVFVADQRFASRRPDVLTFKTPVLSDVLKVEGPVSIELTLQSDGPVPDIDVIVKLIDCRPDGYQVPVRIGARPLRFRNSFTEAAAAENNGEPFTFKIELTDIAHHFQPGHRVMVQVQTSIFPLLALPKAGKPQSISLIINPGNPSGISLPVCKNLLELPSC